MGYMRHHAIVVTGWDAEAIDKARRKAAELGCQPSPIMGPMVNAYSSFFVPPDGSKEGWADSDEGDRRRDALVAWLQQPWVWRDGVEPDGSTPFDWAEVRYGDDDDEASLTRASDERLTTGRDEDEVGTA